MEPVERITSRILLVRGQKIMLDANLAELYGVTTKALNQTVKRNAERFPEDFAFQLTPAEAGILRSQIATSNLQLTDPKDDFLNRSQIVTGSQRHRDPRLLPWVFTEHGALMAANLLRSNRAVQMSLHVVRAFVRLREMVAANKELAKNPQHDETHAALSRFWLHAQDGPVSVARFGIVERQALSQNRASPQRVAARIDTGFVARLANIDILAAPRFAPLPILTRTARAFHHVAGSRNSTNWNAASRITTRRSPAS